MDELLQRLELRVKSLIQRNEHTTHINIKLRQHKALLIREKEALLLKHKTAVQQIESMVSRLKLLEKSV